MEEQIYPIGQQNFKEIRESGKVYVDKTHYIPPLLHHKYFFLSRPRRFGKSLLLSTLEYFFKGEKELFRGLAIEKFVWNWEFHPVVRIDLNGPSYTIAQSLVDRIEANITQYEEAWDLPASSSSLSERFRSMIRKACVKFGKPVVVLIDEYEKPLLDSIDNITVKEDHRNLLNSVYGVLKSEEEYIKLCLITGVSRFGKLNIFSGFNNLRDISLSDTFSGICGITESELQESLKPGVNRFARYYEITYEQALDKLKKHYDGYHFSREMLDIYNPFSLFECLTETKISNNWFESASPTFLIKLLRDRNYDFDNLEGIRVTEKRLKTMDPDLQDPVPLLYQSGYLTLTSYSKVDETYTLGFPNIEVKEGILEIVIPYYLGKAPNSYPKREIPSFR